MPVRVGSQHIVRATTDQAQNDVLCPENIEHDLNKVIKINNFHYFS